MFIFSSALMHFTFCYPPSLERYPPHQMLPATCHLVYLTFDPICSRSPLSVRCHLIVSNSPTHLFFMLFTLGRKIWLFSEEKVLSLLLSHWFCSTEHIVLPTPGSLFPLESEPLEDCAVYMFCITMWPAQGWNCKHYSCTTIVVVDCGKVSCNWKTYEDCIVN